LAAISEQEITKATLRFLKQHYRYRDRDFEGQTILSSDRRGAGGIVADGYLSFPKPGGELFSATFEATSLDKRYEVVYKLRRPLLRWDASAFGALFSAGTYAFGLYSNWWSLAELGLWSCLAIVAFCFVLYYFAFLLLFRSRRRYRYIFAIEQFKQYFADEQWIAIGEDVFANTHQDPYYKELRRQCVHHGFGLLVVREDGRPLMQMTPSRQDLFKSKRSNIALLDAADPKRLGPADASTSSWMRQFRGANLRRYKYQLLFCLIAVFAVGDLLYQEWQQAKVEEYEDWDTYAERMAEAKRENARWNGMLEGFVIDTPYVWPYPIRQDIEPYEGVQLSIPDAPVAEVRPDQPLDNSRRGFIAQLKANEEGYVYDCSRIRQSEEPLYILQIGKHNSYSAARQRIEELRQYNYAASAIWLGCFGEMETGYALYLGLLFTDLEQARKSLLVYQQQLGDNVLGLDLRIRALNPR
jgi:hypothetical protein